MIVTDLETVDPKGRFDSLVYQGVKMLVKSQIEERHGLAGVWDNAQPIVNQLITQHVSGIEIPSKAKKA